DGQALRLWAAGQWQHPLSVADLAERTPLSTAQFAARCREEQGLAAMAWLRSLRLEQAQWLRARGLPVAEVARRTGYRSPSALTAALRRRESALRDDAPTPRDGARA
ncbi:MAG: helix-turn-helix domain-containing protein, partial [Giesbergeria sp.]|nr:helix-turn-helix domain-containing protein [Giesbergeria sp.]